MSIASQISRIAGNVAAALQKIALKGITVPADANSDDLADLIDEIPVYDDVNITQHTTYFGLSNYFNSGTSTNYDAYIAPVYSCPEGHIVAHNNTVGTRTYFKIKNGTIVNPSSETTTPVATIGFGKKIKIGKGYYDDDAFYIAQNPTGGIIISSSGTTYVGPYATATVNAATPTFSGGNILSSQSIASDSCDLSPSVNNSGIVITPSDYITRQAVLYDADVKGFVTKSAGDSALSPTYQRIIGQKQYLNGVTLTAPESGERTFTVTLPNGENDTITLTFTVDSSGNWSIE